MTGEGDRVAQQTSWMACGASVTGYHHRQRGLGCDDAYGFAVVGDSIIAAVADGAGSVSGTSAWGAHVACQSILADASDVDALVTTALEQGAHRVVQRLYSRALERANEKAAALGVQPHLLATTLSVAIARGHRAVFAQIGDGVIAVHDDGGIRTVLAESKHGYANTTSFLQSEEALETSLRTASLDRVTAFALSSDGMAYKVTDISTGAAYEPFFDGCWRQLRSGADPAAFGAVLEDIRDDQTGDDKTMVLAVAGRPHAVIAASGPAGCSPPPPETTVGGATPAATTRTSRRRWLATRGRR